MVELGEEYSPEEIMGGGTGHASNKAFERYFQLKAKKKRQIAARTRVAPVLHHNSEKNKKGKLLKMKYKNGAEGGT